MIAPEADPIAVVLVVTEALDRLGVRYFVGGSLAVAVHGVVRATADADVIANLGPATVERLVSALEPSFFVDADSVRRAVRERRSFNVLHL
jgi:hypothetical protein